MNWRAQSAWRRRPSASWSGAEDADRKSRSVSSMSAWNPSALCKTITYTYDNLNRRITVQDPGPGIVTTVYDAGDNVVNIIDPLGHKGTMVYDELGRQSKAIDALGATTTYLYDLLGNRTGLI